MDIPALIEESHSRAVRKGWWPSSTKPHAETIALIHSELSEALEEYRAGRYKETVYYFGDTYEVQLPAKEMTLHFAMPPGYEKPVFTDALTGLKVNEGLVKLKSAGGKPEGFAVELADVCIRIFDYCGFRKLAGLPTTVQSIAKGLPISSAIAELHYYVSTMLHFSGSSVVYEPYALSRLVNGCVQICFEQGLDLEKAIRIKSDYNETRPERHGGKLC